MRASPSPTPPPMPLVAGSAREYVVADFASLPDAARAHLDATGARVHAMVAAVAGRVDGDEAHHQLPWVISIRRSCEALGLQRMRGQRLHRAIDGGARAQPDDVSALGPMQWSGKRGERGNARTFAIIGPGTGLGVGGLLIDGRPTRSPPGRARRFRAGHAGGNRDPATISRRNTAACRSNLVSGMGLGEPASRAQPHRRRRSRADGTARRDRARAGAIRSRCAPWTCSARCSAPSPATSC